MESRAAVFTSSPQDVEIYSAGEWLPGSMLGWRHDDTGGCQVWVRLAVGGAEESVWTDLECVRLPERHLTLAAPAPVAPVDDAAATRSLRLADVSGSGSPRRGRPAVAPVPRSDLELTATRGFPAIRDESASRASHPAGRRRAESRVVGETAEFSVIGAGRHRAPASPSGSGRHRAADTGTWPTLVESSAAQARTPEGRAAESWGARSDDTWPGLGEPDLLTRPMRLDAAGLSGSARAAAVPTPRAARWDDTLTGV
ncbi:hypothetical protein [Petropleomorpha daqingensis]|uniref:Uncharacterized protein n=1 Tax=Petropleomorpha daqingensis TaxID=2026353 RepID=A0A853C835_9ACTN|nr:hypothetical protein [Petropleomorpha daqingensis]NYJ04160.1 hypothetical protein [Petropleomorpha daqingensis]